MSPMKSADVRWLQGQAPPGIVTVGDFFLQLKTRKVLRRDSTLIRELARQMLEKLEVENAQGLAAPQVREPFRLIVIKTRPKPWAPDVTRSRPYVMVNPTIVSYSSGFEERWEGCLSVPGLMGLVRRYTSVEVGYEGLNGEHHHELFTGYIARVVQHEIDHLDNLTYLDRIDWMRGSVYVLAMTGHRVAAA